MALNAPIQVPCPWHREEMQRLLEQQRHTTVQDIKSLLKEERERTDSALAQMRRELREELKEELKAELAPHAGAAAGPSLHPSLQPPRAPAAAAPCAAGQPAIGRITEPGQQQHPPSQALPAELQGKNQRETGNSSRHGESVGHRTQRQKQRSECGELNLDHGPAANGG